MTEPPGRVRIRVGNHEYDKPYDPECPACACPVLAQLDMLLSYGWTYERVLGYLRQLRIPGMSRLTPEVLAAHIGHLAPPHAEARRQLEADATARGVSVDDGQTPVVLADMARLTLQRAYEAVQEGDNSMVRDAVALLRLQRDIEKDERGLAVQGTIEQWQAATREILWIARKHLGPNWAAFVADLRGSDSLRAIMPTREEEPDDDAEAAD
jgi:hypothetical protein